MASDEDRITHFRQYLESKTLGVGDMPNPAEDWTVQIENVTGGKVSYNDGPASKAMLQFVGVPKKLAAGALICGQIRDLYGTGNPKAWRGKWITLFATVETHFGKKQDCIRVRNVKPEGAAQAHTALNLEALLHAVKTCSSLASLESLKPKSVPKSMSVEDRDRLKVAFAERREFLEKQAAEETEPLDDGAGGAP